MTACSGDFTRSTVPNILPAILPLEILSGSSFGNSTDDLIGTASSQILRKVALYMVSNGLVKPQHEHAKAILEWFQPQRSQSIIKSLVHRNDPTSRATFTNIFRYAVIAANVAVLNGLPTFTYSHLLNERHPWFGTSRFSDIAHTALDFACIRQNTAVYIYLASLGATNSLSLPEILEDIKDIKVREHQGSGPLGRIQIEVDLIGAMLKNGITVCRCSQHNHLAPRKISAFVSAFTSDDVELMKLLLDRKLNKHQCIVGFDWIKICLDHGSSCSSAMLTLLINAGVRVPLRVAIASQNTKVLQHMLEGGSDFALGDLEKVFDQRNINFIADACELFIKHQNPMRQSKPSRLSVVQQPVYNCDHIGSQFSHDHLMPTLEKEDIDSSRSRKIDSMILHILSLPYKHLDSYLDPCLQSAVESGCEYAVKALIRAGACTTHGLVLCANEKDSGMTSALLDNVWSNTYLERGDYFKHAIETGDRIALCKTIDAGYDINSYEQLIGEPSKAISPLGQAIRCNQSTII
jgi:hypothetical protein